MSDLLFARLQMAISLGFHIVFACIGIGMPLMMAIAEWRWIRTGSKAAEQLTKQWAKGTAIFFAVGAVSGTVLSFELGLLWPGFMRHAGGIIGFPFSLEGFAFFTEAIFLGIYLYGWNKMPRWAHWGAGVVVALSGVASAVFVVMANAWMNAPAGFVYDAATKTFSSIDPIAAMFGSAWLPQVLHMVVAAYMATAFGAAGVHALKLLKEPRSEFHREALKITMVVGLIAAALQPITGDYAARTVAKTQPVKLAAMEGHFRTERGAPLFIGGWPDEAAMKTRWAIGVPKMLSFLAYKDFNAEVKGLEEWPREDWPPVPIVHVSFQIMVGLGTFMLAVAAWWGVTAWRSRKRSGAMGKWLLRAIVVCCPMGFIAVEAGWTVTEVGRQPWIIHGVMRTSEAVTPMKGLAGPFVTFMVVYAVLGAVVGALFVRRVKAAPVGGGEGGADAD